MGSIKTVHLEDADAGVSRKGVGEDADLEASIDFVNMAKINTTPFLHFGYMRSMNAGKMEWKEEEDE